MPSRARTAVDTVGWSRLLCGSMKTAVSTQVLIQGLVRSPDREGALAHLDSERGFAFVARGAMTFSDVIDPTIWVKEKLSLAFSASGGAPGTPPPPPLPPPPPRPPGPLGPPP